MSNLPARVTCPHLSIAILGLSLAALGHPREATAQADICVADGGTAECVGPEVSEYKFWVGSTGVPGTTPSAIASEAPGIASVQSAVLATYDECSSGFEYLPWIGLPAGAASGYRTVTAGVDSWYQEWSFGTEGYQRKTHHRIPIVFALGGSPPCAQSNTVSFGSTRQRALDCPVGYSPNQTAPSGAYCWRPPAGPEPRKDLGRCKDCDLLVGNPVNVATGNRYLEERDYLGAGAFPLEYTRRYNSLAYTPPQIPTAGPAIFVRTPNWQGTYDRALMYAEHLRFPVARAYRHDGRVLEFSPSGGQWVADADVTERLTRLVDGSGNPTGWQLTTAADEVETYDVEGRLLSIRNRAGITHTLSYDSAGWLTTVTHSFGGQLAFTYDASNRLATMTVPGGQVHTYGYTWPDNLTSVTYPGSIVRTFHYENGSKPHALTGITDESSVRFATYAYDTNGKASQTEHAGGVNRFSFSYPTNTTTTVTDPLNTARTWTHASVLGSARASAISQVCPTCGSASKTKTFDANGNVASRTDFNNNETRYIHDLSRNLETSRTEAYGTPKARTITTQWHASFRLPTQIDEPNRRTSFTHDANGNVLTRTVTDLATSATRAWTYTYNSFGQVLTENGPRTDVTDTATYTYYGTSATCTATVSGATTTGCRGQVQTITNALSHVTTFDEYNAHGQPLTITDPNGLVTTLIYDARQHLTSRSAGGETTTLEYWPTGLLKKVTLPDASFLLYTYDNAHRLTRIDDSEGNHVVYTLDAMGNRTKEESFDPSSFLVRLHHRAFNSLNQLWQDIGAANTAAVTTTFGYDDNGNQTSAAAPLGRNSASLYDELNRLTQLTDPASGVTAFGYDANDNLASVTDPRAKVTSYAYSGFGDLKTQVSPDTGTTSYTYDSGGNLHVATDARSKTATHSYDVLNRVTQIAYGDQTITHTYDAGANGKGRLTGASDSSHSMSWTYDAHGRVTNKSQTVGTVTKSVTYGYTNGNLTSMTTPSGQNVAYGYNSNHQVTSVSVNGTPVLSSVLYDPFGPARGWTWGNGTLAVRTFDTDGKVTQIDSAGLKTYGYDDAFRITSITDTVTGANSYTYGYDLLDRLSSAVKTGTTLGWTYDANGNRQTQTGSSASTFTISSSSNRLSSVSGALTRTYSYDAAGNTLTYANVTATYNDRGRMKTLKVGTPTATYVYNALGQRIKRSGGSPGTVLYWYDEAGHLLGEYNSTGVLVQETVWLGDIPVATLRPGTPALIFYVHTDHLNTPRKVTRPSDNKRRWQWEPDPFGTALPNENPEALGVFKYNLRRPGQLYDSHAGLSYNYFRDYDPATGRYPQSDPIGLRGGINTYGYAGANPIMASDPFGLFVDETGAFIQMCAQRAGTAAVAAGSAVAAGVGMMFFPSSTSQCDVVTPRPEANCPEDDDCAKLYAQIDAAVRDLKRRYGQYADDPLGLPATGPFSRRTHREQFEQRQKHLRRLLDEANIKGCLAYDSQAWTWATRKLLELPRSTAGGQ